QNFDTSQLLECTIECNPEDLSQEYVQWLHDTGLFNRISIGVQSFDDNALKRLNRRHTGQQAIDAVWNAYRNGFDNISIDLIYGLPQMSNEQWTDTLHNALSLPINHISAYSLSIDEGTIFNVLLKQGKLFLPTEDDVLEQYDTLIDQTAKYGFTQYEISNFAKSGCESIHNSRYWRHTPYIGIGAAAHSFSGRIRRWNVANIDTYIDKFAFEEESLTDVDICNETIMLGLRTNRGICIKDIPVDWRKYVLQKVERFIDSGLLEKSVDFIKPSRMGLLQADGIARDLFVS
ncbi:radical SAM protein, partial [bacterium]|nr:radical SAM protein [bacterium]